MPVETPFDLQGNRILPCFFATVDHPFLRRLLECYEDLVGRPERTVGELVHDLHGEATEPRKRRFAEQYLWRAWPRMKPEMPAKLREQVFRAAAASTQPRDQILEACAGQIALSPRAIETSLFADLPGERRIQAWRTPSLEELCLRINLSMIQSLIAASARVHIRVHRGARALVRHARVRGLMCKATLAQDDLSLELSGPYSLFRRTMVYGRRLGQLVPLLGACGAFEMHAECGRPGRSGMLALATGAPIFPTAQPPPFERGLEERFIRDFGRATDDWTLIPDPDPAPVGDELVFPDFVVEHRRCAARCVIEIVGFWMPDYLERKIAQYRALNIGRLILLVDELASCSAGSIPDDAAVIPFRHRIDTRALVANLDAWARTGQEVHEAAS